MTHRRPRGSRTPLAAAAGTACAAESFFADNGVGCVWQIVDLRKPDGTHYRLAYGPDGETCDCPQ